MRKVILESPYAGNLWQRWRNRVYARRCVRDALQRGEAPIASHLLYTQRGILRDGVATERRWGIEAGLAWCAVADASVVYIDRGISAGMRAGVMAAQAAGLTVEFRALVPMTHAMVAHARRTVAAKMPRETEIAEQAVSFAYGNCAIGNAAVTRAMVADAHRAMAAKTPREQGGSSA
jgi:hypothetical protein